MIINPNNIDKWCFDYFEGNLSYHEKLTFERFILEHPEYHAEFDAWKNASDSDDDNVPAYYGVEGLIVSAPFYTTMAFRVTVGLVLSLALGAVGYYQLGNLSSQYISQNNSLEMSWSPEDHLLALVKFEDYAYGDYEVKTITNTTHTTNYMYENSDIELENGGNTSVQSGNDIEDSISVYSTYNNDNDIDVVDETFEEDLLSYKKPEFASDEELFNEEAKWSDSYQEDEKSLYQHLGINHGRYSFLNFNNGKVKGIGGKNKNSKKNNHATISQSKKSGKGGNVHKKKSHFLDNLKHSELGLTNINDPIALTPNNNTIGVNPALAGQLGVARVKLNVRNQWWNTDASLFRGSLYFDAYIDKLHAGVSYGTQYDMTEDGHQRVSMHSFTYAQKFSFSKNSTFSVGLTYELSKGSNMGNQSTMNEFYMSSPVSASSFDGQWKSNFGVSTWYSGKYFFGGFNVTNLSGNTFTATHEEITSYVKNLNYSVQLGTDYKRSMFASTVVSPYVQYNRMGDYQDIWLGSAFRIKGLVFGGSVATSRSAKAMLGLQGNKFRFTVSSDYSKSMLIDEYAFSHEVSLRILLGNKNNNWSLYDN